VDFYIMVGIGSLLLLAGVLVLLITLLSRYLDRRLVRSGVEVEGTVIATPHSARGSGGASRSRQLVVEYHLASGERQELTSSSSSDMWDDMKGQKVAVYYDPDNPDYAMMEFDARATGYAGILVALVLAGIGGFILAGTLSS
jgi:hypothetical protein